MRNAGGHEAVPHFVGQHALFAQDHGLQDGGARAVRGCEEGLADAFAPVLDRPEETVALFDHRDVLLLLHAQHSADAALSEIFRVIEAAGILVPAGLEDASFHPQEVVVADIRELVPYAHADPARNPPAIDLADIEQKGCAPRVPVQGGCYRAEHVMIFAVKGERSQIVVRWHPGHGKDVSHDADEGRNHDQQQAGEREISSFHENDSSNNGTERCKDDGYWSIEEGVPQQQAKEIGQGDQDEGGLHRGEDRGLTELRRVIRSSAAEAPMSGSLRIVVW